ncbi:MAG: methyl-accepting chemotaxis protein, partial [Gammaproteobacteria bacterium]|nr:methyl-accepting chemotaxis protein [Gammaproteobacteria bacterium]
MKVKSITIKLKFILVSVFGFAALLAILLLGLYSINTLSGLERALYLVEHIESGMLMLRRNEKDFLARNDLKYQDNFSKNFVSLQDTVAELDERLVSNDISNKETQSLSSILLDYNSKFQELVNKQKTIGLSPKDGLYGDLRSAVHSAEEDIKKTSDAELLSDILMLRRREKDFMLRNDLKYLEKFNQDFIKIESRLNNSIHSASTKTAIQTSLQEYQKHFQNLVNGYKEKGLSSKSGLLGEMRETVHKTETIISK